MVEERRTEQRFRAANERLLSVFEGLAVTEPMPFICECPDPACTELVELPPETFARATGSDRVVVPAHRERIEGEVVEDGDGYAIVRRDD